MQDPTLNPQVVPAVDRRSFLRTSTAIAATVGLASSLTGRLSAETASAPFTLPALPYAYDALSPVIDEKTMTIHHAKHHQGYVDKLNAAVKDQSSLSGMTVVDLLISLDKLQVPADVKTAIRNNGGGHANHTLFWAVMQAPKTSSAPSLELSKAIQASWGSMDEFKAAFSKAAATQFGSGWAWLVVDGSKLSIVATANQDSPISMGKRPILGLDVWEHAYYLNYQNRRPDYVSAWWDVVNWDEVSKLYSV